MPTKMDDPRELFLHELGDFVLRRQTPPPPVARVRVTD